MKKIISAVVISLVLTGCQSLNKGLEDLNDLASIMNKKGTQAQTRSASEQIDRSNPLSDIEQICSEFDMNSVSAKSKYLRKYAMFNGSVSDITQTNDKYFFPEGRDMGDYRPYHINLFVQKQISVFYATNDINKLNNISKGQAIKLSGIINSIDKGIGYVGCSIGLLDIDS